ncbi:uncharacterized protein ACIB01_013399 [Guaruba guarouba]
MGSVTATDPGIRGGPPRGAATLLPLSLQELQVPAGAHVSTGPCGGTPPVPGLGAALLPRGSAVTPPLRVRQGAPQCGAAEASRPPPWPAGGAAAAVRGPCAGGALLGCGHRAGAAAAPRLFPGLPPRPLPAAERTPPPKGGVRGGPRDEGAALRSPGAAPVTEPRERDVAEQGKPGENGAEPALLPRFFLRCWATVQVRRHQPLRGYRCSHPRLCVWDSCREPRQQRAGTEGRGCLRRQSLGTGCRFSPTLPRSGSGRTELSVRSALARARTAQKRLRWEQRLRALHRLPKPRWWLCEARPGTGSDGRPSAADPSGAVVDPGGAVWGKLIPTEKHGPRGESPRRGECPDPVRWDRGDGSGGPVQSVWRGGSGHCRDPAQIPGTGWCRSPSEAAGVGLCRCRRSGPKGFQPDPGTHPPFPGERDIPGVPALLLPPWLSQGCGGRQSCRGWPRRSPGARCAGVCCRELTVPCLSPRRVGHMDGQRSPSHAGSCVLRPTLPPDLPVPARDSASASAWLQRGHGWRLGAWGSFYVFLEAFGPSPWVGPVPLWLQHVHLQPRLLLQPACAC